MFSFSNTKDSILLLLIVVTGALPFLCLRIMLKLGFGLGFIISVPIFVGFFYHNFLHLLHHNCFLILCYILALTVISMGFYGIFASFRLYMLPRKRAAADGVVVIEADPETSATTTNNSAASSSFKKHRLDSCIIAAAAANQSTAKNGDNSAIIGGNSDQSNSRVVESSPSIMALGDSNHTEIDEDLHSRQLAVYGRETMRRLFASNILISGMQGLGAEIGMNILLPFLNF